MLWILLVLIALVAVIFIPVDERHDHTPSYSRYNYSTGEVEYNEPEKFQRAKLWFPSDDSKFGWFVGVLLAGGVLAFVTASILSAYGPLHAEEIGRSTLVAVSDGSKTEAAYYLFSGYSDDSQIYSYYEKNPDGSFQRGWQYAAHSVIFQDSKEPYLDQYYLVPNQWLGFTGMTHLRNQFHIPAGSIQEKTVLDNK